MTEHMDTIVFEGQDEVIIANAATINAVVTDWFLEGGRSLDDYNVYLADSSQGFSIKTSVNFHTGEKVNWDITALMPDHLREKLITAGLLTDES